MKIKVNLKNSRQCEGCPFLNREWCFYYGGRVDISNATGGEVMNYRLQKCLDENGE